MQSVLQAVERCDKFSCESCSMSLSVSLEMICSRSLSLSSRKSVICFVLHWWHTFFFVSQLRRRKACLNLIVWYSVFTTYRRRWYTDLKSNLLTCEIKGSWVYYYMDVGDPSPLMWTKIFWKCYLCKIHNMSYRKYKPENKKKEWNTFLPEV